MHTNYQPAKPGLIDRQIAAAKSRRCVVNHLKRNEFGLDACMVRMQRETLRYSDQGDFTRCYRGGF